MTFFLVDTFTAPSTHKKQAIQRLTPVSTFPVFAEFRASCFFEKTSKKVWKTCILYGPFPEIVEPPTLCSPASDLLIRREWMLAQGNPQTIRQTSDSRAAYSIFEFVDVKASAREAFRAIMLEKNCPIMESIIEKGTWCQAFLPLESHRLLYHDPQFPAWNQLHLITMKGSGIFHYRRDFGAALQKIAPQETFDHHFQTLKALRHFVSKGLAKRHRHP